MTHVLKSARPTTVVVHCLDPRFQGAFKAFIQEDLSLKDGEYIPIVIAGGASVLARSEEFEEDFFFVGDQLEFLFSHFPLIERVVLINHEDCGRVPTSRQEAEEDLQLAAETVKSLFSSVGIRLFYAAFDKFDLVPLQESQLA